MTDTSSHGDRQSENKRALTAHSLCFPPLSQRQPFESSGLRMITTPLYARGHLPKRLALPGIPDLPRLRPYLPRLNCCNAATRLVSRLYGLSQGHSHPGHASDFPSLHRPTGKSFWKGGARGGRTFFQKGFPPRKLFHQNKKIPGWYRGRSKSHAGRKIFRSAPRRPTGERAQKRPPRAESSKGVFEQSLAAAYFPT